MKLNKLVLIILCLFSFSLQAQDYLFPVKPGQRNYLSGNFAEIRPNHFHSGIDVKIGGVDGEPILAIADGYVYRLKVSSFGYGNVLYIKHDDGSSSVYAHLQKFSPKIAQWMHNQMYAARENEHEAFPSPEDLIVKRGEVIGNGGNTGSSGGPHLHFEIRDSLDRAIDPLTFGFSKEVKDNTPPILYKVALKPLTYESRVNGVFERQEFTPILEGGKYVLPQPVKITGKVGLEVYAVDKKDDVHNIFGIPKYELWEDDRLIYKINVDHIDFNIGRFLLTHTYQNKFTRLYPYPNNPMRLYEKDSINEGLVMAMEGQSKKLLVQMSDVFGNRRALEVLVEGEMPVVQFGSSVSDESKTKLRYEREVLVVDTKLSQEGNLAKVYVGSKYMEIAPAYVEKGRRTYVWDMNYAIPDSIDLCTEVIKPNVIQKIPFGKELNFRNENVSLRFSENSLLDDLFLRLQTKTEASGLSVMINSSGDYLQQAVEVILHGATTNSKKDQLHVYSVAGNGRKSFVGGTWEGEDIKFKTRNFGTFVLDYDEEPPRINPVKITAQEIRFRISDDKSGVKDFEAFVNGEWVLMKYEHKQAVIWSEKLNKQPFKGEVLLKVRDMAGNESTWTGNIQ
ncbi:M23 family metallopeptidase [Belliella kenyensis]|uniref:M23 family metallopeptidase n=1 Tax=Belliella kenyensis TaxID=1472724 RepID=A0ABV8EH54_9BACT|nr:M23 family metallopeptidase [Belliella kenyensis]MCH7401912.1 M23 family metallopeptidase [Belliella kenyensis]MDN3604412.1 M23 family metallopeptidase [Belliella kenyensis]